MIASGWKTGSPNDETGAGYGIRISLFDRDEHFRRVWSSVTLELGEDDVVQVNLSNSFWNRCSELRKKEIGKWMLDRGLAPWPKGYPPQFRLEPCHTWRLPGRRRSILPVSEPR